MTWPNLVPPWMRPPTAREVLIACANLAEHNLALEGFRGVHCVAGEDGDRPFALRVHALADVPADSLWLIAKRIEEFAPMPVAVTVTSWVTHPRADVVSPRVRAAFQQLLVPPGEACGTCGTRAVRARRCGFCGARG